MSGWIGRILATVMLLAVTGGAIAAYTNRNSSNDATPSAKTTSSVYDFEEVARHASPEDCWTVIENSVYDLSAYIGRHPGGVEIEKACGTDATELFTKRESSGQPIGSGMPHSDVAREQLERLKIGTLSR